MSSAIRRARAGWRLPNGGTLGSSRATSDRLRGPLCPAAWSGVRSRHLVAAFPSIRGPSSQVVRVGDLPLPLEGVPLPLEGGQAVADRDVPSFNSCVTFLSARRDGAPKESGRPNEAAGQRADCRETDRPRKTPGTAGTKDGTPNQFETAPNTESSADPHDTRRRFAARREPSSG